MENAHYLDHLPIKVQIEGSFESREIEINGQRLNPAPSQKVVNHSPDGFNWGYGGSGPAQLSLAILLLYWPKNMATKYYQDFKFKFIGGLPRTDFNKTVNLREIMHGIMSERAKREGIL